MATYKPVTQAEADTMFLFWQESGRNTSRTAKQFKKGRTSIQRYIKKFGWKAKADTIETKKINAIAEKQIDDLTMVTALQKKVAKSLLARANELGKATVSDFALLTRLKLEIQGELPAEGAGNSVTVNLNAEGNNGDKHYSRLEEIYRKAGNSSRFNISDN